MVGGMKGSVFCLDFVLVVTEEEEEEKETGASENDLSVVCLS